LRVDYQSQLGWLRNRQVARNLINQINVRKDDG
jgi:hypothetical protein